MIGTWHGAEVPTGHPMDGLLEASGWWGKQFIDAETVRDVSLAVSGLLTEKIGRPSVYPPAPDFLFQPPTSYGPKIWAYDTDADKYRRALYTFRYRSVPYPAFESFDAPRGDVACVRRPRSNTPPSQPTTSGTSSNAAQ